MLLQLHMVAFGIRVENTSVNKFNMKRIILALTVVVISLGTASAQSFHLGAKAGANLSKVRGSSFKEGFDLGYQLGGFAEIDFSKSIGVQPEVLFSQTNTTYTSQTSAIYGNAFQGEKKLNYLSIPILLRINASKLLTINVGPQYSILMNQNDNLVQNGQQAFKSGDFSLVGGVQLNLNPLKIYGRYNIGLSNINDINSQDKWKNEQIQLGVGLRIL
jgi:hypothetical protein